MFKSSRTLIGLDLGSSAVKALQLTLDGAEPVLTGFGAAPVTPEGGPLEAALAALAALPGREKRCILGVGGPSTVVRYISMLPMPRAELVQAVTFEADKYLPFDPAEVVLDCEPLKAPLKGEDDKIPVLVAACRRQLIQERVALATQAGLVPSAVDLDLFALANAWELSALPDDLLDAPEGTTQRQAIALIDMGATRTSINVLLAGRTCFSREMAFGGDDMTAAVARRLSIELSEAEQHKCTAFEQDPALAAAIAPVLEDLASEIAVSIDYVEHHESVEVRELLISGGASRTPGVVATFEQVMGRQVRLWNPLEGLRVEAGSIDIEALEDWSSSLAVALGLAGRVRAR